MKLLTCKTCGDIRSIRLYFKTWCRCGESWGIYTDWEHATFGGQAIPLGISNTTLDHAVTGNAQFFTGFVYGFDIKTEHIHLVDNATLTTSPDIWQNAKKFFLDELVGLGVARVIEHPLPNGYTRLQYEIIEETKE